MSQKKNNKKLIIKSDTPPENKKKPTCVIDSESTEKIKSSTKSSIKSSTNSIKENPCDKETKLKEERKVLNENIKKEHNDCEITKYEAIYKYFNNDRKSTYKDLLNALMHFYKEKKRDPNFILPFESFLDMFEKDTNKYKEFKKQHVFEALCKILLMYDYDNGELGRDKQFYNSLENFVKNPNEPSIIEERDDIINNKINESSEGGVVDIFFKTNNNKKEKYNCEWSCDCVDDIEREHSQQGQEYILIQNKYYSKEKSDIKNYDVTKIFAKAQILYESKEITRPRIILMVNNRQALSDKLTRSRDASKGLIDSIYGVYEIDKWFNLLLYDLLNSNNIDDFLEKRGTKSKIKPELGPRFHQMYFTESTIEYRNQGYKKFIWGAVPRSGKSYMIGDLISRRKEVSFNDVIIILGAKTETESQFIKMFCEFSNYSDYGIIKTSTGKMESIKNCDNNFNKYKEKNIYIFSQDWFKNKLSENIVTEFDFKKKSKDFETLFKKGNTVDIYFDEVHKGGSTDKSENILNAINTAGVKIDIFIMVTATFAKPNIKYKTNFIDTKEPKILEWSYEDQQIMKNIKNETKMDMMINSRTGIERNIIQNIFNHYKNIYNNEFLDIISKQYARHPELVLVQPFDKIKNVEDETFKINKIFKDNLNCEACFEKQTIKELRNPNRIFFNYGRVQKLLQLIAGNFNPNNSVYGYLKSIGAPDYADKHSELWFLPDDDLYVAPDTCREKGKCKQLKLEKSYDENKNDNKQSLPNIEALTRGLAFALMDNNFFKEYYNVLIVHNTPVDFKNFENGNKISYEEIFKGTGIGTTFNSKNLSESIREFETETYRQGKNLIILTGAKLRLGISLPCVDIGFNFDNVQSVDVNYQTMFRVLTERYNKPKPFGYYVDFNKERFITFLYQYGNTYSSGKNISNIKENISNLQGLLFLFNINGIGIKKLNVNQELKLYDSLIEELKLNENGYKTYYSDFNNITNLFKKSLINVNINDLQKLKTLVDSSNKSKEKPKKIKVSLVEGEKVKPQVTQLGEISPSQEETKFEDEDDDNDSNNIIINIISDILPRIIALIALFSNKDNYDCEKLDDCLENSLRKIQEFGNTCKCNIINKSDILSCYLNSPFYSNKLTVLLKTIKELLNKPDNQQLHVSANFIFNNIREMGKQNEPLIYTMTPEDIQKKIEQYLPVREEKKQKNGEVFTPMGLIEEMLDDKKLPPSVWTNPELKWLDPANGIGNFPMVVYAKLFKNLPDTYKGGNGEYSTEQGKKEHIVEKMLYMNELDSANVKISRRIFGKNANICCSDFIKGFDKCVKQFGFSKFDIIMGNPPYNATSTGRRGEKNLDDVFINESLLNYLNKNGYLLFVTKTNWRSINSSVYENVIDKQIVYIKTYDFKNKPFSENLIPCYYLIKNSPKTKETIFEYLDETEKNNIIKGMNIYFLYRPYLNYLDKLKKNYGNLSHITRQKKDNGSEYLLISFSTPEVLIQKTVPAGDKYYIITNPNKVMKFFFQSNIYKNLRELGRFSGFSTPKALFHDIPDFNKITKRDEQNDVLRMLGKYNNPKSTGLRVKKFITEKHREKHGKTKKNSKGGNVGTRKKSHGKKTRKSYFSLF
jgi:hypothetical protein